MKNMLETQPGFIHYNAKIQEKPTSYKLRRKASETKKTKQKNKKTSPTCTVISDIRPQNREKISHRVCGTLLWQPSQTNIVGLKLF